MRGVSPGDPCDQTWPGGVGAVRGTRLLGFILERIAQQEFSVGVREGRIVGKRAYDLRHTFGTEMYRRTHDPLVVQQLMLHRSSETTRRYILGAVPDVLQRAVKAVDEQETASSIGWQSG